MLFAPVPYSGSINKSSAYHFGPVRIRILRISAAVACRLLSRSPPLASALFVFPPPLTPSFFHLQLTKRGSISLSLIHQTQQEFNDMKYAARRRGAWRRGARRRGGGVSKFMTAMNWKACKNYFLICRPTSLIFVSFCKNYSGKFCWTCYCSRNLILPWQPF